MFVYHTRASLKRDLARRVSTGKLFSWCGHHISFGRKKNLFRPLFMNLFLVIGQKTHLPFSSCFYAGVRIAYPPGSRLVSSRWPIGSVSMDNRRGMCGFVSLLATKKSSCFSTSVLVLYIWALILGYWADQQRQYMATCYLFS